MKNKTVKSVVEEIKEFQNYAKSFGFEELNSAIDRFEIVSENDEEYNICYGGSNEMQTSFKKYSRSHVTLCYMLTWYEAELVRDMRELAKGKPYPDEFLLINKKLGETMIGFFYYREGR